MRKSFALIISCFFLSACSFLGWSRVAMLNSDDSEEIAISNFEEIIEAINVKDSEKIIAKFSLKALEDVGSLEDDTESLINLLSGQVISWDKKSRVEADTIHEGTRIKKSMTFFVVETNQQQYDIWIYEVFIDTERPENIGIFAIRIYKSDDQDRNIPSIDDKMQMGIFFPEDK